MVKFTPDEGVPECLSAWKHTISDMLATFVLYGSRPLFVTVDQSFVKAGQTHRRGGAHIDGNWIEETDTHHNRNLVPEAILLANNIEGTTAVYLGHVDGSPEYGGSCDHLPLFQLTRALLRANTCYEGNVECIHECLPVSEDCYRQMIRIVIPGQDYPIPTLTMSQTATTNSSHAPVAKHPFLDQVKTPMQKLLARKAEDAHLEKRTAYGIEQALNSLEDIPGVPGKLHFKILVTEEGYQAHAKLEKHIITL